MALRTKTKRPDPRKIFDNTKADMAPIEALQRRARQDEAIERGGQMASGISIERLPQAPGES